VVPSWVLVLALALLVLAVAWPLLQRLARRAPEAVDVAGDAPRSAAASHTLARARELGEAGRHLEAVHVLLLVAVEHWTHHSPVPVHPDLTSRELLRFAAALAPGRAARGAGRVGARGRVVLVRRAARRADGVRAGAPLVQRVLGESA
jgi:hypothetical protein